MACSICGRAIHLERLAAQPRVVTCSAACSRENQRLVNIETTKNAYHRQKEAQASAT